MGKILLIDGHNLLFKMFFGMPFPFYNKNNKNITGTVGFIGTVVKMIKYLKVDQCLVVFDGEGSLEIRDDAHYKLNRQIDYSTLKDEDNPFTQLKYIKAVLDHLKIKWIETDCIECDDYIAMVSMKYDGGDIFISSTDTDFYQLIKSNVKVIRFRGKDTTIIDEASVYNKYSIYPSDFALYKSLVGDKSDNIEGVAKVGAKTAVNIINSLKYGRNDKFYNIYIKNKDVVEHNMKLIKLPNENIDLFGFELGDYIINSQMLKNFKNLKLVTEITNDI